MDGIWTLSRHFDSIGGLSKSVKDLAGMTAILQAPEALSHLPGGDYERCLTGKFKGLKIGFLDPSVWKFSEDSAPSPPSVGEQMVSRHKSFSSIVRLTE